MDSARRKKVVIIQAMCKLYRRPLFTTLQKELLSRDIDLQIVYSTPPEREKRRNDNVDLPATLGVRCGTWILGERLLFQPCFREMWDADLIIVEHAFKYVLNPFLLLLSLLKLKKLGVWVHGGDLRKPKGGLTYLLRKWTALLPDWRFAYTEGVAEVLKSLGARKGTVTVLHNAVDLTTFRAALADVSDNEIASLRRSLGILEGEHVALFCGSIYAGKGMDFVIAACDQIRIKTSDFHLLVIGAGPDQKTIVKAAETRPWLHYLGAIHDDARAPYFRLAHAALMPYLTGLGILDAMAAGLPYIVTGARATNPEIDYLMDGRTGIVTGDSAARYASAVSELFADPARLRALGDGARSASFAYSIETMATNFALGITQCLQSRTGSVTEVGFLEQRS